MLEHVLPRFASDFIGVNLVNHIINRHMQIIYDIVCGLPWIVRAMEADIIL